MEDAGGRFRGYPRLRTNQVIPSSTGESEGRARWRDPAKSLGIRFASGDGKTAGQRIGEVT